MNTNSIGNQRCATEKIINQIENCLTERLLRRQGSELRHPIPALVPQISHPSPDGFIRSPKTDCSGFEKKPTDYFDLFSKNRTVTKADTTTSANNFGTTNSAAEIAAFDSDISGNEELASYIKAALHVQPDVNWRLLALRSRAGAKYFQTKERNGPLSTTPISSLDEGHCSISSSTPNHSSTKSTIHDFRFSRVIDDRDSANGSFNEDTDLRNRSLSRTGKTSTSRTNRRGDVTKPELGSSRERRNGICSRKSVDGTVVRRRQSQKLSESLSNSQHDAYTSLRRRLEYDPQASAAKDGLRIRGYEKRDRGKTDSKTFIQSQNDCGDVRLSTKEKVTKPQSSLDFRMRSRTSSNHGVDLTTSSSQAPKNQRRRSVGQNREPRTTDEVQHLSICRTRSECRRVKSLVKSNDVPISVDNTKKYSDLEVESISLKLERLAKHVVLLRKLVERDYAESGSCSPGDDIYVDEEVGALSHGKPTGMHPCIANSLRSIRVLEANVQELFDMLYANEIQLWSPNGLTTD